jgi:hypothetical protein
MLVCIFFVLDRTSVAMAKAGVFQKNRTTVGRHLVSMSHPVSDGYNTLTGHPVGNRTSAKVCWLVGDGRLSSWVVSLRWVTFAEKCDLIQHMEKQTSSRSIHICLITYLTWEICVPHALGD